jgi:stage V sporulation protein R
MANAPSLFTDTANGFPHHKLTPELRNKAYEIFELARDYGLTSFPIRFIPVSPKELNAIAAYDGFPKRMPHWSYGMEFESIHTRHKWGQSKIYELVINTNPVIAYLLNTNTTMDQKLVMIHVCGHADFFFNNSWFQPTDRSMLDQMANNAIRVQRYMNRLGESRVEDFTDVCMSLNNLVDPYLAHIKRQYPAEAETDFEETKAVPKLKANDYMDRYINTEEFIRLQKKRQQEEREKRRRFPEDPTRDVLGFLVEHAPKLERWQRNLVGMVREEAYYFAPQMMTKIMNEGWASYVHSKFMTGGLCDHSEIVDYCDAQSRVMAQGMSLNPYRLGVALYRDIEERWNKGRFGLEYERCSNLEKKLNWDTGIGKGKEKIFQVRRTHNDITFLDDFLTPEFCKQEKLFSWKPHPYDPSHFEVDREFDKVKSKYLRMLANAGRPVIQLDNGNYQNKGELKLTHVVDGQELDDKKGKHTLENIFKMWTRPVHIETLEINEDTGTETQVLWSYDGQQHTKAILE